MGEVAGFSTMIGEPCFSGAHTGRLAQSSRWSTGSALLPAAFGRGGQEGALQHIASDLTHVVAWLGVDKNATRAIGAPCSVPSSTAASQLRPIGRADTIATWISFSAASLRSENTPSGRRIASGRPDPREETGPPHRTRFKAGSVQSPPVKRTGYITFGSFNKLNKMTPEVI
jgi:hypothetical protein